MTGNEIGGSVIVGFYMAHIMEWLKHQPWFPWLAQGRATVNRIFGWGVALVTALGVHWTFSPSPDGGGSLLLSWPHLTVATFLADVLRQYAAQKFAYATTIGDHPNGKDS